MLKKDLFKYCEICEKTFPKKAVIGKDMFPCLDKCGAAICKGCYGVVKTRRKRCYWCNELIDLHDNAFRIYELLPDGEIDKTKPLGWAHEDCVGN